MAMPMTLLNLPTGFCFEPTDTDLVDFYLRRRATTGAAACVFPGCLIQESDVYATEPWNLPSDSFLYQGIENNTYFFTPRYPTKENSQRARRTAGCGVWLGCGKDKHIKVGSRLIGHKTQLTFVIIKGKDKKEKINTGWIMHEFWLPSPPSSGPNKAKFDDLVLCRIHFKKNNNSNNKCWEYAGSVADSGAVSFTQQQEEEEAEGRLVKRRRFKEDELMAGSNIETRTSGINVYTGQSAGQPAAPLEEPRELASMASNAVSLVESGSISKRQEEEEDADADFDYALSLERQLVEVGEEEEEAVRRLTDSTYETQTSGINIYTESSGHPVPSLSSSFSSMPTLVLSEEPIEPASMSSDVAYVVASAVKEPREPELQQRLMARADNSTDMSCIAAAAVGEREQIETETEERLLERRRQVEERGVENTESTSCSSQFNTGCNLLADLYCLDDLGSSFPPLDADQFSASSSFLAPPISAANHISDNYYNDGFDGLAGLGDFPPIDIESVIPDLPDLPDWLEARQSSSAGLAQLPEEQQ